MRCERCRADTNTHTMSMFNTENICMKCKIKEVRHPDYNKAREIEWIEIKNGNYNYQGIGCPPDLRPSTGRT